MDYFNQDLLVKPRRSRLIELKCFIQEELVELMPEDDEERRWVVSQAQEDGSFPAQTVLWLLEGPQSTFHKRFRAASAALSRQMDTLRPQRGDVIVMVKVGYRNDFKFIFDGEKLVFLDYSFDDYGGPTDCALALRDVDLDFWDQSIDHNTLVWCDLRDFHDLTVEQIGTYDHLFRFSHNGVRYAAVKYDAEVNKTQFEACYEEYHLNQDRIECVKNVGYQAIIRLSEEPCARLYDYDKMRTMRADTKRELTESLHHPRRVQKWIEAGYDLESYLE